MRHLSIEFLAVSGLLFTALTASAQYRYQEPPSRYLTQDERVAQDYNRVFDRVRTDLDHAHDGTLPLTADRDRVKVAEDLVSACQHAIGNGDYDRRSFDQAISAVQRVADLNRLSDQNRNYLLDDIRDLGRLQSQFERY